MKYLYLLALSFCMTMQINAQNNDLQQAARSALQDMQKIASMGNYAMLGLESAEVISNATIGDPITQKVIGLENLRAFKGSPNEVQSLLENNDRVIIPVMKNNEVVSVIALDKSNKGWKTASLGMTSPITEYEDVRRKNQLGESSYMVRVPAFNQYFITRGRGSNLEFASIGQSAADLKNQSFIPASEALKLLQPIAQRYNGLPW